jgi:hypothetical protein
VQDDEHLADESKEVDIVFILVSDKDDCDAIVNFHEAHTLKSHYNQVQ